MMVDNALAFKIKRFFSDEAGQDRRAWLDENLASANDALGYYLGPTGIPDKLSGLGEVLNYTDAGDMIAAADASRGFWNSPSVGNAAELAAAAGALAIPFVGARMMDDGVDVLGDAYRSFADDAGRFAADESGSVPLGRGVELTPSQAKAQEALDMLKSGRASEVTDDMMAAADDMYLYDNYDLPMDEASRMARAGKMGFGIEPPTDLRQGVGTSPSTESSAFRSTPYGDETTFHATDADFKSFNNDRLGSATRQNVTNYDDGSFAKNLAEYGHWASDRPLAKELYRDIDMPILQKGYADEASSLDDLNERIMSGEASGQTFRLPDEEFSGFSTVIPDPANIRSRFARFDPRLAHLRNISAGIGAAGVMTMQSNAEREERALRNYLGYD